MGRCHFRQTCALHGLSHRTSGDGLGVIADGILSISSGSGDIGTADGYLYHRQFHSLGCADSCPSPISQYP